MRRRGQKRVYIRVEARAVMTDPEREAAIETAAKRVMEWLAQDGGQGEKTKCGHNTPKRAPG